MDPAFSIDKYMITSYYQHAAVLAALTTHLTPKV